MSLRKKSASAGPKVWTVAELGAFYTEHRSELVAHASRIIKDRARAEEIIQDALIKVMLASPELESSEHALGYMHRTIENLCIDIFRIEGRRPNLVLLDDAKAEVESLWIDNKDHSDVIAAADDAAIVRQALAMLSPAERAALVMWEMEGRSTAEIAMELGVKESTVRHTVARARASMRRILSELIIDHDRGLTALDLLSQTYKRTSDAVKKSSKAALTLILLFAGILGFQNINLSPFTPTTSSSIDAPALPSQSSQNASTAVSEQEQGVQQEAASPSPSNVASSKNSATQENVKSMSLSFPGLNSAGVPTGFSVADSSGNLGSAYFTERSPLFTETDFVISQIIKTDSGAANIFISQYISLDPLSGLVYQPTLSYGSAGAWIPLATKVSVRETRRLDDGTYLLTAYITVKSEVQGGITIAASAQGRDLDASPKQIITRILLDATKSKVLKQAIYVVEAGAKA